VTSSAAAMRAVRSSSLRDPGKQRTVNGSGRGRSLARVGVVINAAGLTSVLHRRQGPDLQNVLRFIIRLSYVYRKIELR